MKKNIPSYKQIERKYGELLSITNAASYFNLNQRGLSYLVKEEKQFSHLYFEVDVDIQRKEGIGGQSSRYYFPKAFLEKEKENLPYLMNLRGIAKELGIPYGKIRYMQKMGYLEGARYTPAKYDLKWVKENISEIQSKIRNSEIFMPGFYGDVLDFISTQGGAEIVEYVNLYIQSRINGEGININGEFKYQKKMKNPEKNAPLYKNQLAIALYKLICGRSGIKNYSEKNRDKSFRELTTEELQIFNPGDFLIWDISKEDVFYIKQGYTDFYIKVFFSHHFIPFLYFVKNKYEERKRKYRIRKNYGRAFSDNDKREYEEIIDTIEIFEEGIQIVKQSIPIDAEPIAERLPYRFKREELALILNNLRTSSIKDKLKKECVFLFGVYTGIRPGELAKVKISDIILNEEGMPQRFMLDPNTEEKTKPSKKTMSENGYGLFYVRKEISKGEYSPSPVWGNYLAPVLVNRIADYLEYIYTIFPERRFDKNALLFPAKNDNPYLSYTHFGRWISINRDRIFPFVPEEDRGRISFYSVRHTVAEWIINDTNLTQRLERYRVRAGQTHLRHSMNSETKKRKSVKEMPLILSTYTDNEVSATDYILIMQESLDFPINLDGELFNSAFKNLDDWKKRKGQNAEFEIVVESKEFGHNSETELNDPAVKAEINFLETQIKEKQLLLAELQLGYNKSFERKLNMTRMEWLSGRPHEKLEREIEDIKGRIKKILNPS